MNTSLSSDWLQANPDDAYIFRFAYEDTSYDELCLECIIKYHSIDNVFILKTDNTYLKGSWSSVMSKLHELGAHRLVECYLTDIRNMVGYDR